MRVVGHPPGILLLPRERPTLPATREEALSLAANNNFNVISANFAELAARDNIDVVREPVAAADFACRQPQPVALRRRSRLAARVESSATIMAQMTCRSMRAGRSIRRRARPSRPSVSACSQVDDARRAAVQTTEDAWETLKAARASIASFAAAVRAAQIALEGTQQEALVGTATTLDVLVQNQTLLTTQQQLITAEHDAALAEYNLAAGTGRLIAADLHLPVQLYDMERHYRQVKDKWGGFGGGS